MRIGVQSRVWSGVLITTSVPPSHAPALAASDVPPGTGEAGGIIMRRMMSARVESLTNVASNSP